MTELLPHLNTALREGCKPATSSKLPPKAQRRSGVVEQLPTTVFVIRLVTKAGVAWAGQKRSGGKKRRKTEKV
ncbi:hypothetical protein BaRGS_00040096 [Batillaria attramentaria]|uniref:Uncharacterized protein n=1 Tax=Batillaria attramentaria TaxID=370345 RepID=A0ABD0J187_9CAEN